MDWEAEGLLDGVDGAARDARRELLEELLEAGFEPDELRRAAAEERLSLLPVERQLVGDLRYTADEVAERSGIAPDELRSQLRVLGLAVPGPDDRAFTDADVEDAKRGRLLQEAGVSEEDRLAVERVLGAGMARYAEAFRVVFAQALLEPGDTERDIARRYAAAMDLLRPIAGPHFAHVFFLHMRQLVRSDVISAEERTSGSLAGRQLEVAVAFADLVGFTKLGETLDVEELGGVASRLTDVTSEVIDPPVRLVKSIGDAVMLVSPDPMAMVEALLRLLEAAEAAELPPLRAGVAYGPAVNRAGDWFGSTVNLASRLTSRARPRSVLAAEVLRKALGTDGDLLWSSAGEKKLKGFSSPVKAFRVRRAERDGAAD